MVNKNNFITGITDLLVLAILKEKGDSYVYEINKYISNSSKGLLKISHNTIYTVMYKLVAEKKVSEYSKLVGKKRTRVYYHIEPAGRKYLDELLKDYFDMSNGIRFIFDSLESEEGVNG